ncbi:MAG TPA: DUF4328 domain-containing protein [Actinomycetota bacterium]
MSEASSPPGAGLGTALRWLLAGSVLVLVVLYVLGYAFLSRSDLVLELPTRGEVGWLGPMRLEGSRVLWVPWLLAQSAGIVWLVWQHRATTNLWERRYPGLRVSPGWAVGWWFVPIANLWMPFVAMRELDRRSTTDGVPRPAGGVLGWWWAAWLCRGIVPTIGISVSLAGRLWDWIRAIPEDATSVDVTTIANAVAPWLLVAAAFEAVAAALAIAVVARIDAAQRALAGAAPPAPQRPDAG